MAGARRCARTANTPAPSASVASPSRPSFAMPNPQDDRLGPHIASFAMAFHQGLQALASARMPVSCRGAPSSENERQTRSSATARPAFVHLAKVRIMLKRRVASSSSNGGACDSPGAVGKFFAASV
jgi:hypothetical protein